MLGPGGGRRTALPGSHGAPPWPATLAALVAQHACEYREWHQRYDVGRDGDERHRALNALEVDEQCVKQQIREQHDKCHGLGAEPHDVSNIYVWDVRCSEQRARQLHHGYRHRSVERHGDWRQRALNPGSGDHTNASLGEAALP